MAGNWGVNNDAWNDMLTGAGEANSGSGSGWGDGWEPQTTNAVTNGWGSQTANAVTNGWGDLTTNANAFAPTSAPVAKPSVPIAASKAQAPPVKKILPENKEVPKVQTIPDPVMTLGQNSNLLVLSHLSDHQNITIDKLRMVVNHHAQDSGPGRNSFQDHVSEILFTPGQDIAFVNMETMEATERVQNRLNGSKCFDKKIFSAIVPSKIQFKNQGSVPVAESTVNVVTVPEISQQPPVQALIPPPQSDASSWAVTKNNEKPKTEQPKLNQSTTETLWGTSSKHGNANGGRNAFGSAEGGENAWGNPDARRSEFGNAGGGGDTWGNPDARRSEFGNARGGGNTWGNPDTRRNTFGNADGGRNALGNPDARQNASGNANRGRNTFGNADRGRNAFGNTDGGRNPLRNPDARRNAFGNADGGRNVFGNTNTDGGRNAFGNADGNQNALRNPDAPRGGFRGGRGRGGRDGFANRNFEQDDNQNIRQNNWNPPQSEEQQNGFKNSNWGQPQQKTFFNSEFRSPNGSESEAPPSKVIMITGLDADVKRQDIFNLIFPKTQQLIDFHLQRYNTGINGEPPKAFLLIEFPNVEEASKAIEQLKDIDFMGMKLMPKFSRKTTINVNQTVLREHRLRNRFGEGDNLSVGNEAETNPNLNNLSPNTHLVKKETEENHDKAKTEQTEEKKSQDGDEKIEQQNDDKSGEKNAVDEGKITPKEEKIVEPNNGKTEEESEKNPPAMVENQQLNESSGNTSVSTAEMMTTTSGDTEEKESDEENKPKMMLLVSPQPTVEMEKVENNGDQAELKTQLEEAVNENNGVDPAQNADGEEAGYNSCSSGTEGIEEEEKENKPNDMEGDADFEPPVY